MQLSGAGVSRQHFWFESRGLQLAACIHTPTDGQVRASTPHGQRGKVGASVESQQGVRHLFRFILTPEYITAREAIATRLS